MRPPSLMSSSATFHESRRSTRVPLKVVIAVEGDGGTQTCDGETIIINLHGALICTAKGLRAGMRVSIHVYVTDKRAAARVVYIDPTNPLQCGIELDEPRNIWGVPLPPEDWQEGDASETGANHSSMVQDRGEKGGCPYCIVNDAFQPMRVLSNGRLICEKCGHIVFPHDTAFRCPCQKCLEINFSPRVRRLPDSAR